MENGVTLSVNGGEDGYEALEIEKNEGGNIENGVTLAKLVGAWGGNRPDQDAELDKYPRNSRGRITDSRSDRDTRLRGTGFNDNRCGAVLCVLSSAGIILTVLRIR